MSIGQIWIVLRARWRLASAVLVAVVASVAAISLSMAPQYKAVASVVLDVKSPDPIAGVVLPGMTMPGYLGTQLGVIQSERVLLRALRAVRADESAVWRDRWQQETHGAGDFKSWLADTTLRSLDVVPARDSSVIMVSYKSPDRAYSAALVNAVVKAYIETTLEMRVDPAKQFSNAFDGSAKQIREELERAQTRLSAYQQAKGIVANDEKFDVENLRLAELSSQVVAMQALANESGSRQTQSGSNLDRMPEVLSSPMVVAMTNDLSRREGRMKELTTTLGENNPQVIELRASIAEVRGRIDAETRRVSGSLAVNNSVNQSRLAQMRESVNEQRSKVLQLKSQRDESAVLQRDVENAQRAYDAVLARATASSVESRTTQTNVSVLKEATPPASASSPRLTLNIAVSLFVGVLLAIGAAVLRESSDRRLRTAADITLALRQPLLGVMPKRARAKRTGLAQLRLTAPRGISGAAPGLLGR